MFFISEVLTPPWGLAIVVTLVLVLVGWRLAWRMAEDSAAKRVLDSPNSKNIIER